MLVLALCLVKSRDAAQVDDIERGGRHGNFKIAFPLVI